MDKMTATTVKALGKYGLLNCLTAWHSNDVHGEGANSIRLTVSLPGVPDSVPAVDACIAAGREVAAMLRASGSLSYRPNGEAEGFSGAGVNVFRAAVIASALRFYAKTGVKVNRAYTPSNMMTAAREMTGRQYKTREYERAAADLSALCQLLKVAIGNERGEAMTAQITALLDEHYALGVPGSLPVLFKGDSVRHLGYAFDAGGVDDLLRMARLTAQKISRAKLEGDAREFFIAHA